MSPPAPRFALPEPSLDRPRRIVVLGSTGSIGVQALEVVDTAKGLFRVEALTAGGGQPELLVDQAVAHQVRAIGVADESRRTEIESLLDARWPASAPRPELVFGAGANAGIAALDCDIVLNGVAGALGLRATMAALQAGRVVALANKESLIAGGPLVLDAAGAGQLVPVDSEHSALAQCLRSGTHDEVAKLVLTASGGPFRGRARAELADVTPAQALVHPTWNMGRLITTNSATLVNKGLELIEAALLFDIDYDRIGVVVHPTSVIHSMVEFVDGATLAQASPPDMKLPISLALGWPHRVAGAATPVDWSTAHTWTFEPLDDEAFGAVELARTAGKAGGCAPAVFNQANEVLVQAFHDGRCGYLDITDTIGDVLHRWLDTEHAAAGTPRDVADVEQAQDWAVRQVRQALGE